MTAAPRILCVGTHHKTGTTWMRGVFFALSAALGIPRQRVPNPRATAKLPNTGRVFATNWRSRFHKDLLASDEARFMHLIRDPRDVLISGALYHEATDGRNEKFLYHPRKELDGKSYQEHLRGLATYEEKLAFEMGGKHLDTIRQMRDWDYDNPRSMELKYEDLIEDTDCTLFRGVLEFFGLSQDEVDTGAKVFHDNSLFGKKGRDIRKTDHVRSGRAAQWMMKMPMAIAELYLERHGADLIRFGYENDDSWIGLIAENATSYSHSDAFIQRAAG